MNFDRFASTTIYLAIYRIWRCLVTFIEKYPDGPLPEPSTGRQVQPFKKPDKEGYFPTSGASVPHRHE